MSFENDLHDWYIDGVTLEQTEITLFVHLYEARKKIKFIGVTRCLLDNLMMTNIIYVLEIISAQSKPDQYNVQIERLEASYPAKWTKGLAPQLLLISASVGLEGLIEFQDLEVIDL